MNSPIVLKGVSVRFTVPKERIRSFKEYTIHWLKRRIEYEDFWAIKDLSLAVNWGEMLGIVGKNGAGKSTLLKVVSRIMKPIQGMVSVNGKIVPLIEVHAGFDHEMTGRENIFLNGSILGYGRNQMKAKFDPIVDFSELGDFIDAPLRTYSSGMLTRLGFAIATEVDADILLLDEILAVGDLDFQKKCLNRIKKFRREGTTIIFVSHSMEHVRKWCDRALWLDRGSVRALGPVDEVVAEFEKSLGVSESREGILGHSS
ncbi:MAG: ABC transporter ATP-binding protein [Desulfomonilaceae bacterium]